MKKIITLIISILILVTLVGLLIFKLNGDENNIFNKSNDPSVDFYAIKTHGGFNDVVWNTMYKITNEDELEMFYKLYDGFYLSKDNYDLSKNTIFIETLEYGSGSVSVDFKGVSINKNVKFKVSTDRPEIGTCDMAYWYLVAIIPNTKLNGVNVTAWKSPIDVNNSLQHEYIITIECDDLDLKDSLNIIEKAVNDTGNIKIQRYHYSPTDNKKSCTLISYDEKISEQLIQNINNQENGMIAQIYSTSIKDENEYKFFQETLNKTVRQDYQINLWSAKITTEKGKEIAEMLNSDEIVQNGNGHLNIKFNDFGIEKIESNISIISQHITEWSVKDYYIDISWRC